MVKIEWSLSAIEDIEKHLEYIEQDNRQAAQDWAVQIFENEDLIAENPYIGRIIPEENLNYKRELILGNFRLMYEILSESKVVILKVMRSKQLFSS
jgi:toxin ParE1/3/4